VKRSVQREKQHEEAAHEQRALAARRAREFPGRGRRGAMHAHAPLVEGPERDYSGHRAPVHGEVLPADAGGGVENGKRGQELGHLSQSSAPSMGRRILNKKPTANQLLATDLHGDHGRIFADRTLGGTATSAPRRCRSSPKVRSGAYPAVLSAKIRGKQFVVASTAGSPGARTARKMPSACTPR